MEDTDNEGIGNFLDEMKEDIKTNKLDEVADRMPWLLSVAMETDNRDLFVIEGMLRLNIRRGRTILKYLKKKSSKMEKEEANDILKRASSALVDMTILSKDYLRDGDKTNFFDSVSQAYLTVLEINETLRLGVRE
jgi:hypothetical protein